MDIPRLISCFYVFQGQQTINKMLQTAVLLISRPLVSDEKLVVDWTPAATILLQLFCPKQSVYSKRFAVGNIALAIRY